MFSRNRAERILIVRVDDNAGVVDPRSRHLFNENAEDRFLLTVAIDKGLKRQMPLPLTGRGDNRLGDFHFWFL
jgi:hypothetical protein